VGLAAAGCGKGGEEKARPELPTAGAVPGPFAAIETKILAPKCTSQAGCHGGTPPAGGLDLGEDAAYGNLVGVKASRRPERLRVAPGDPDGSYLVNRLLPGGDTPPMPLGGPPLSPAEIEAIKGWIRDGAKR
jgi:hypothetical protein